ncbi:DNA polymerase/3'-5' exonuclease PolX [Patescibacteria group bacterium]
MDNKSIASVFEDMSYILDIKGDDFFRVNAYKRASLTILNLPQDLRDVVDKNPKELSTIPGIGKALAEKITELVLSGKCKAYEKLKKGFPMGLLEMLKIRTLGPKKVKLLYSKLKIKTIPHLKKAAEQGKIHDLEGMGEKSEKEILKAIKEYSQFSSERHLISEAMQEAERIIDYMKQIKGIKQIEYAGSLRRAQDTIGDIDILLTVNDGRKIHQNMMEQFVTYSEVINVIAKGDTKSSVILNSGIQVDLRVVENDSFGAALHYFTGNKQHNIKIRDLAKKMGLKVNEYGIFKGKKKIAGKAEQEIFNTVNLPYIIPELRNGDREIDYAKKNKKFPNFLELTDIKGDLHVHSTYSDGEKSIEEMAKGAMKLGYQYIAMADHSSVIGVTQGMGSKDIKKQWKEIDSLNKKFKGKFHIYKSSEVDILKDGSLDFADDILEQMDFVIIAAHLHSRLSEKEQTNRLIAAIEHPCSSILAHPSGRLINKRPEMNFNLEKVFDACHQNNVAIEINSNPSRLDLIDKYIKPALCKDVKFVINTDAHNVDQLDFMRYGVGIARRGWLQKKHVLNTKTFEQFDNYF